MKLWFKNRKSKKIKEKDFIPLYPNTDNIDNIYVERVKEACKDSKILNIGITGGYGSGKSSVIQGFLKDIKREEAFIVSLASFENDDKKGDNKESEVTGIKKNNDGKFDSKDLEIGILQQIIYCIDSKKIPLSNILRIKEEKEIFLNIAISFFICIGNIDLFNNAISLFFPQINALWLFLLFSTVVLLIAKLLGVIMNKFDITAINLNGIDFSKENSETSILNKYIDEILYILRKSKCKYIIFEDIDRFDEQEIFYKLRELNKIVNDNNVIRKRGGIKFIYAIRDDILKSAEARTKFFDYIIPIIPVISFNNAQMKILSTLKQIGLEGIVSEKVIQNVSYFVKNMRLVINICNEFKIYYEKLFKDFNLLQDDNYSVDKLFAIIAYKNVEIEDFQNMQYDDGYVNRLIEYKQYLKEYCENEILKLENERNLINDNFEKKVQEIRSDIIRSYFDKFGTSYNTKICSKNREYFNREWFLKNGDLKDVFEFGIRTSDRNNLTSISELKYNNDWENKYSQIIAELNANLKINKSKVWEVKRNDYDRMLIKDIYSDEKKLNIIKEEMQKNLDNQDEAIKEIDKIKNNKMLLSFVVKGYIAEDYKYYLNNIYLDDMTLEEYNYIANIKTLKDRSNYNIKIKNFDIVYSRLDDDDFNNKNILNIDLLNGLFIKVKNCNAEEANIVQEKIQLLIRHIIEEIDLGKQNYFLFEYFKESHNIQKDFVNNLVLHELNVLNKIASFEFLSQEKKEWIIKLLLLNVDRNVLNSIEYDLILSETINNFKNIDIYLLNYLINKKFLKINDFSGYSDESKKYIINNNLYRINENNINVILKFYGHEKKLKEQKDVIDTLLSIGNDNLNKNIMENLKEFVEFVNFSSISEKTLIILLNSIDSSYYEKIIKSYSHDINDLASIKKLELKKRLISDNKVKMTMNNINIFLDSSEIVNVVNNINQRVDEFFIELQKYLPRVSKNVKSFTQNKGINIKDLKINNNKNGRKQRINTVRELLEKLIDSKKVSDDIFIKILDICNERIIDYNLLKKLEDNLIIKILQKNYMVFDKNTYSFISDNYESYLNIFCINNFKAFSKMFYDLEVDDAALIQSIIFNNIKSIDIKDKADLLNKFGYIEINPLNEIEAQRLLEMLLLPDCNFYENFDYSWFKNVFYMAKNDSIKIKVLEKYLKVIVDKDCIVELIKGFEKQKYKNIIPGGRWVRIEENDEIVPLIKVLKRKGIISYTYRNNYRKYYFNS